jgi:hypothetical protein
MCSPLTITPIGQEIMTPYYALSVLPLTHSRRLSLTGSARVTCAAAIHDRFLVSGARLLQFGLSLVFKGFFYAHLSVHRESIFKNVPTR